MINFAHILREDHTVRKIEIEEVRMTGEGNWLGKSPHNFMLTAKAWELLHELAKIFGVNHSNALELIIRFVYFLVKGRFSEVIKYLDMREGK